MIKTSNALIESEQSKESNISGNGIKVIGKIDLPTKLDNNFEIISEEDLLRELVRAEDSLKTKGLTFIGLKSFVTNVILNCPGFELCIGGWGCGSIHKTFFCSNFFKIPSIFNCKFID